VGPSACTIEGFVNANGYETEAEFYDAAVSDADPVTERPDTPTAVLVRQVLGATGQFFVLDRDRSGNLLEIAETTRDGTIRVR
jgi:hypothetical protein